MRFQTKIGRQSQIAWIDGEMTYDSSQIAREILEFFPQLKGQHIRKQLECIGLIESFDRGHTPFQLPHTFA